MGMPDFVLVVFNISALWEQTKAKVYLLITSSKWVHPIWSLGHILLMVWNPHRSSLLYVVHGIKTWLGKWQKNKEVADSRRQCSDIWPSPKRQRKMLLIPGWFVYCVHWQRYPINLSQVHKIRSVIKGREGSCKRQVLKCCGDWWMSLGSVVGTGCDGVLCGQLDSEAEYHWQAVRFRVFVQLSVTQWHVTETLYKSSMILAADATPPASSERDSSPASHLLIFVNRTCKVKAQSIMNEKQFSWWRF